MREHGFVSNRIYDALACGACVISDEVAGLDEMFGGAVATYRTPELHGLLDRLLAIRPSAAARRARTRGGAPERDIRSRVDELLAHLDRDARPPPPGEASSARPTLGRALPIGTSGPRSITTHMRSWPVPASGALWGFMVDAARIAPASEDRRDRLRLRRHIGDAEDRSTPGVDYGYFIEFAHDAVTRSTAG